MAADELNPVEEECPDLFFYTPEAMALYDEIEDVGDELAREIMEYLRSPIEDRTLSLDWPCDCECHDPSFTMHLCCHFCCGKEWHKYPERRGAWETFRNWLKS